MRIAIGNHIQTRTKHHILPNARLHRAGQSIFSNPAAHDQRGAQAAHHGFVVLIGTFAHGRLGFRTEDRQGKRGYSPSS